MLNSQQMAAVKYIDGPLLVLAGAGSGKTRVITQKIGYLINSCGYNANSICAVTFTNKAANEMRARVSAFLPAASRRGLKVATFHTLGLSIIKRDVSRCDLKPGFSIFDSEDCLQILRGFLPVNKATDRDFILKVQQQISLWKNNLLNPELILQNPPETLLCDEALTIYPRYQEALKAYNAVDFDDLIRLPVDLLNEHADVLEYWQNKIRHLLVDEYQDSNTSQYLLVKKLAGVRAHFTVVGDDDQSIYAWRGAKPENLAQLQKDFPRLKIIKLEQNYRSTSRILHAANHLIAHNQHLFEKKLWSDLGHGESLRVVSCKDEQDEAEHVIADLISHKLRNRTKYSDYAILYRGNHQARIFEKVLRHHGIPYHISGGQSWFAKLEVRDIFAYLKLLCNEADDAAFLRAITTPKRGIGESSLDALGRYAQSRGISLYHGSDHLALSEFVADKQRMIFHDFKLWMEDIKKRISSDSVLEHLRQMVEDIGYEAYIYEQCDSPAKAQKKMDNVWELLEWVNRLLNKEPEQSLMDVVNKLILIDILEQSDESSSDVVQLMTLHASKGLEFPFVYLVGMEEELLPHRVSIDDDQIEEERRLAYVGITRAQKGLCFTLAKQRRRAGELQDCVPSRFLDELPQESLEWFGKGGERCEEQSKKLAKSHLEGLKNLLS
ncbi:TPA: UvrD-helicase domain-containing protein [Legionella pneumophila]|uniref:UvrD-helicase domain-containing protein n=1 Tax=Legionella pneumophila TaxID=446 RepID=UPI001374F733|nr:UvrD-helicase domain-containing protein [Legionella pneumophila]HAT9117042.1 AAA family ATPase [Legionella pneumophila subsp. pneumophila]MDW8899934.1 3'-5' exonuclease [Legionella pneumophila]MDW8906837.1 3'-5' exonuclease [Legionella pneumophila]MDW9139321.1 3'-5' exonuclease [Legionella pneumophila]MDW9175937.1 3'-5' exonuclease [Legionella pneumophila]